MWIGFRFLSSARFHPELRMTEIKFQGVSMVKYFFSVLERLKYSHAKLFVLNEIECDTDIHPQHTSLRLYMVACIHYPSLLSCGSTRPPTEIVVSSSAPSWIKLLQHTEPFVGCQVISKRPFNILAFSIKSLNFQESKSKGKCRNWT